MTTAAAAPTKLKVDVIYNAVTRAFEYRPHEHGRALLRHAEHEFHIPQSERENLRLYQPDDTTEVDLEMPLERAGVKPDTTLTLRAPAGGGKSL
jgi:hypothetical protein